LEIFIIILTTAILGYLILTLDFLRIKNIKKRVVLAVFILKIISGVSLTMLYSYHYGDGKLTGDTAHYFNDGKVLNTVFSESPKDYFTLLFDQGDSELIESRLSKTEHWTRGELDQFNDNRFIIRINSLMSFISWNSLFVHIILFGFLALVGYILAFKSIIEQIPRYQTIIFLILCLFPSLLFWTSSILKESLLVLGFGLFLYGLKTFSVKRITSFTILFLGVFILINTKIYFFLCLILGLMVYLVSVKDWKKSLLRNSILGLIIFLFLYGNNQSESNRLINLLSQKQKDFILVGKGGVYFMDSHYFYRVEFGNKDKLIMSLNKVRIKENVLAEKKKFGENHYDKQIRLEPGNSFDYYGEQMPSNSFIEIPPINNEWVRFVKYSPIYLSNVAFRPFPWEKGSALKWVNILENLFFFFLLGFTIYFRKKWEDIDHKMFYGAFIFILSFYLIIGATTPVVGALVRYRTPAFLIWMLFFLSIIDLERINLKFNKNTK
jgi:hypothetical protein